MDIRQLEAMLASGQDNALLRFTLGSALFREKRYAEAAPHLARAVELDPDYSAAWKVYARSLIGAGDDAGARTALQQGMEVAQRRGDMQALREMEAWKRKLQR